MEAAIVLIAIIVVGLAAIVWERQYTGDATRTYQVSRAAYYLSVASAFTWVFGYLFAWPIVADIGIAVAVVTAAVYFDTSRRLAKKK